MSERFVSYSAFHLTFDSFLSSCEIPEVCIELGNFIRQLLLIEILNLEIKL